MASKSLQSPSTSVQESPSLSTPNKQGASANNQGELETFTAESMTHPVTMPSGYFLAWDEPFLEALRAIYRGFYAGDEALFDRGVRGLQLECAKDLWQHRLPARPAHAWA